jgi:hypothetical protein
VFEAKKLSFTDNMKKIGENLVDSVVPFQVRGVHFTSERPDVRRIISDNFAPNYENNNILAIGSVSGLLAVGLLVTLLVRNRRRMRRSEWLFWAVGVPFTFVLGIATNGTPNSLGVGHVCGQTLVYMGVALVAASLMKLARVGRIVLLHGIVLDVLMGVMLPIYMESAAEDWGHSWDWDYKRDNAVVYLGDQMVAGATAFKVLLIAGVILWGWQILRGMGFLEKQPPKQTAG